MGTTTGSMTFREFERLPEEENKLELIDGELNRMPPPQIRHTKISHRIFRSLDAILRQLHREGRCADLGDLYLEAGYHMGENWAVPDVSITHAGQAEGDYIDGAPALAVEVISKANTAETMQRKVRLYMEHGAREVWVLYPRSASVLVHRGKNAVEVEGTLTTDLLPGMELNLSDIFEPQPPRRP